MATHHGKEGVVKAGGTGIGELTGFTLETTSDVVEDTQLSDSTKSFLAGRSSFSGTLEMSYVTLDGITTRSVTFQGTGTLTRGTA
jgi:hypothetical protein